MSTPTSVDSNPRPNSSRGVKTSSAKGKKKGATATSNPSSEESHWRLRLVSTDPATLTATKDTEKEDLFKAIKESWDQHAPGRMNMSRESRDMYLKQLEQGQVPSVSVPLNSNLLKPWSIIKESPPKVMLVPQTPLKSSRPSTQEGEDKVENYNFKNIVVPQELPVPVVLTPEQISQSQSIQTSRIELFQSQHAQLKASRVSNKESRANEKRLQIELLENKLKELENWQKIDLNRRELYRARMAREMDEMNAKIKAAQEAANKLFEQMNEPSGEEEINPLKRLL